MDTIPFSEKYRPSKFEDIILSSFNRTIFQNIIDSSYFPNILLYGPPGIGKTTTIINIVNLYQTRYFNKTSKEDIIHLNASDDRGVDIIRNQVYSFINSDKIFGSGVKFVILDEVDNMTKIAQHALKTIIQENKTNNVRFCLICNYMSKIIDSLKNEFIFIRFHKISETDIINHLENITNRENIKVSREKLETIQKKFNYDIRSMLNYIQILNDDYVLEDEKTYDFFINILKNNKDCFESSLYEFFNKQTIDRKDFLLCFINYLVYKKNWKCYDFLKSINEAVHNISSIEDENVFINFIVEKIKIYYN